MTNMRMSNQDAIETLRRIQEPEEWEPQITKGAYIALDMAISALQAQDSKNQKNCKTCKHDPPSKKWPCVDCDMREPADRWEPQDVLDINVGKINNKKLSKTQKGLDTISLQPTCNQVATNTIDRQEAIDALEKVAELFPWKVPGNRDSYDRYNEAWNDAIGRAEIEIEKLPSAQPEKEIPKRVRWSGWKGHRYTRYYCPNCEKPVRNDDCYCHRCGQKMMFPKISFSDYVPGEKQQTIVTWEDDNG